MTTDKVYSGLPQSVMEYEDNGAQHELVCFAFEEGYLCWKTTISTDSQANKEALFAFFTNGGTLEQAKIQFPEYIDPQQSTLASCWEEVTAFFGDSDLAQDLYAKFGRATRP